MNAITEFIQTVRTVLPRTFPQVIPQGVSEFPSAVYQIVGRVPHNSYDGGSKMDFLHIDLTIYADTPDQAFNLSENVRTVIETETYQYIKSARYREGGSVEFSEGLSKYLMQYEYRISLNR